MSRTKSKNPTVRVKKRANGRYSYFFEGVKTAGKRTQISKGGFTSKKEALAAGKIAMEEYYNGNNPTSKVDKMISFQDFVTEIYIPHIIAQKNIGPSTKENYEKLLRNDIYPAIGKTVISNITPRMLQETLDKIFYKDKRSINTVSHIHGLMLNIVKLAVKKGYLESFDETEFKIPKPDEDDENKYNTQKRDVIPEDRFDAIFERFDETSSSFLPMIIAVYTGARLGEACAIAIEDIDFENRKITICRQFPGDKKNLISHPKYNSKREVPMCSQLYDILLKAKNKRLENENTWGDNYIRTYLTKQPDTDDYRNLHGYYDINYDGNGKEIHFLNVNEDGKIRYPSVMRHTSRIIHGYSSNSKKKKDINKIIYEDFNFHSLRHTFSSSLRMQGVNEAVISILMGHKMPTEKGASKTTANYIHFTSDYLKDYAEQIDHIYEFKDSNDDKKDS